MNNCYREKRQLRWDMKNLKMTMPKGNSVMTFLQAPKVIQKVKLNFFNQTLY